MRACVCVCMHECMYVCVLLNVYIDKHYNMCFVTCVSDDGILKLWETSQVLARVYPHSDNSY